MRTLAAIGVLLASARAWGQDETIGVRLREWRTPISGHIQGQGETLPAFNIDVDEHLGMDDVETVHEVQAYLSFPLLGNIYAGLWSGRFEGDRLLSETITFADLQFTASTTVESELELDVYYASYEFSLPLVPMFDLGVLAGIRVIHADGRVSATSVGEGQDSGTVAIPVLGVHALVELASFLRAEAEVMGLTFKYGSSSGLYVEAYAEVVGQVGPLFAGLGYKYVTLEIADHRSGTDFDADIHLEGAYLTAGLRF